MVRESNSQVLKELKDYSEDFLFLSGAMDGLKKEFGNKFVVVKNRKVVAAADTIDEVIIEASKKRVDTSRAVIEFVPKKEQVLIL